jgi:ketosteroid isomerase-like protein
MPVTNIDTVKEIYAAFGSGDIPAIIDRLDEDVEWESAIPVPGVPWLQTRRGRDEVPAFFESLAPLTFQRFEPHTFFESGDKVFVLIALEIASHGKNYKFPIEGHLWQFNSAGKVAKFDHVTDTAQMIRMARGE